MRTSLSHEEFFFASHLPLSGGLNCSMLLSVPLLQRIFFLCFEMVQVVMVLLFSSLTLIEFSKGPLFSFLGV